MERKLNVTRGELARRAAPFVLVAALGFGSVALPPYGHRLIPLAVAVVLASIAVGIESLPWSQSSAAAGAPGPVIFTIAVGVAQYGSGAARSGLVVLLALPILFSAIYRHRLVTVVLAITVAMVFAAPMVLIGGTQYPISDWRRMLIWCLIALVIAPVIQAVVRDLNEERRRHLDAVVHLETVLRAAVSHSIIATDVDGLITTFNEGAERMLGYRADEVIGIHTPAIIHDLAEVAARAAVLGIEPGFEVFVAAPRRGVSENSEWTYLTRTGDRVPVRLSTSAMRNADGDLEGFIGVAIEITAERAALAAVEKSERRWRTLLDHLPDTSVLVVDADMRYQVAIGAGMARQGFGDMQGKTLYETSSPDNIERLKALYEIGLAGQCHTIELQASNTGLAHQIEVVPLPVGDSGAEVLVVARDVSEARSAALALRDSEQLFRLAFDTAPVAMMMLDLTDVGSGTILRLNPTLCRYTGYSETTLLTVRLDSLADAEDADTLRTQFRELARGDIERAQVEIRFRRNDDVVLVAQLALSAIRPSDGRAPYAICIMEDITARKYAADAVLHQSLHDPLTGLANRALLLDRVEHALSATPRTGQPVGLLYLDLDGFKQVNDRAGHAAGDELLVETARRLSHAVRPGDTVARLGGDEFAVVCANMTDMAALKTVAQRALDSLAEPYLLRSGIHYVTASIGMSLAAESAATDQLFAEADAAMYMAKRAGKNRIESSHVDR